MQPLLLIGIVVVMYFFMIRPQSKKQKEQRKFQEDIQKGDRIVTISGIHGKIADMDEKTITIEMENGKMKLERAAISSENTIATYPKNK
ncbi:MAG: preprotein translocase subunit YajC [Bacteroidetes bacterium]|nr:preprotein translocase subunit YajC [Bacteroidota bacterium]